MKIRLVSDIHLENHDQVHLKGLIAKVIPEMETDPNTVLILAGDCVNYSRPYTYKILLDKIVNRFAKIIFLPGNHEYYHSKLDKDINFLNYISQFTNVELLDYAKYTKIDNVRIIGSTLWTDYNKKDYTAMMVGRYNLNDFNYIRDERGNPIQPLQLYDLHIEQLRLIKNELEFSKPNEKVIVVTHHGPTLEHIHARFKNSGPINYSFTSDLSEFIKNHNIDYWFHGHTHNSFNTYLENIHGKKTNLIANPAGYFNRINKKFENPDFNPKLVIEV